MDTMEMTKIMGGLCGGLLILLLVGWGSETIFHMGGDGHGEAAQASGYPIEVASLEEVGSVEEGPSFEELLAAADVDKGKKVFSKCKACHKLEEGAKGTGPHLFGVLDRDIASVGGFDYSGALTGLEGNWDAAALNEFLTKPTAYAKGTKMTFAGLKKAKDRANLIGYLQSVQ